MKSEKKSPDLFSQHENKEPGNGSVPLAYLCSPKDFNEFQGQTHLLAPGKLLRRSIESDRLGSAIFYGPPGTGKSALTRLIAQKTQSVFIELNAVTAGVSELRKEIEMAKLRWKERQRKTILLVDEIHHFNRSQQDALLPDVEKGSITLIGITTENPFFYVNAALISRSQCYEFLPLGEEALNLILDRGIQAFSEKVPPLKIEIDPQAREHLVIACQQDGRRLLNALEIGTLTTPPDSKGRVYFSLTVAQESTQKRALLYDKRGDEHYDTISAFIKSMRGSDPDATLYWLAKMLEAGEDPRFIARRIVICSSEDVGNADPQALGVALSAFQTVELIGMPEARIPLSQAALYVALAPKSNAVYLGIEKAIQEVRHGKPRLVPNHLKDATLDRQARGHGQGYKYPHNFPNHWVPQEYLPNPKTFYEPSEEGEEKKFKARLAQIKNFHEKK